MDHEIWKVINNTVIKNDKYEISSRGNVRIIHTDTKCVKYKSTNGYEFYLFELQDNSLRLLPIDDIVLMTFSDTKNLQKDILYETNHINGDISDSNIENLRYSPINIIWKLIDFKNIKQNTYAVSNHGDIKNILTNKILKQFNDKGGYKILELSCSDNIGRTFKVHQIVANAFHNKPSDEFNEVNHINGIKDDNYFKNLEYVTSSMNQKHAYLAKLQIPNNCEKSPSALYTNEQIKKVCELIIKYNGDRLEIQKHCPFYIAKHNITSIISGDSWLNISSKYFNAGEYAQKTSDEVIHRICQLLLKYDGYIKWVQRDIESEFGLKIKYKTIQGIRLCNSWVKISSQYFNKSTFVNKRQRHFDQPVCEENVNSKLTNSEVEFICERLIANFGDGLWTYRDCIEKGIFNATLRIINSIKTKSSWTKISNKYFEYDDMKYLKEDMIKTICQNLVLTNFDESLTFKRCKVDMKYLTLRFVHDINHKYTYKELSDKYF